MLILHASITNKHRFITTLYGAATGFLQKFCLLLFFCQSDGRPEGNNPQGSGAGCIFSQITFTGGATKKLRQDLIIADKTLYSHVCASLYRGTGMNENSIRVYVLFV